MKPYILRGMLFELHYPTEPSIFPLRWDLSEYPAVYSVLLDIMYLLHCCSV